MENSSTNLQPYILLGSNTLIGIIGAVYANPYLIGTSFLNFSAYIGYHIYYSLTNQPNLSLSEQSPLVNLNSPPPYYISLEDLMELELSTPIQINDSEVRKSDTTTSVNSCSQTPNVFPYALKNIFYAPEPHKNAECENNTTMLTKC